jgi:predicted nucleotidyltransferase
VTRTPPQPPAVSIDSALLAEITRKVVERFDPRRILLFGSRARGTAGPDSDLDLFIEMESDKSPPQRAIEVSAIFGLRPWPMDLIVMTPAEDPLRDRGRGPSAL